VAVQVQGGRQQQANAVIWRLTLGPDPGDSTAVVDHKLKVALPPLRGKGLSGMDNLHHNTSVDNIK
jgi:hypothetical protein